MDFYDRRGCMDPEQSTRVLRRKRRKIPYRIIAIGIYMMTLLLVLYVAQ